MLNRSCQPYPRTHEFLERILHPLTAVTTPGQGDVLLSRKLVALEQDGYGEPRTRTMTLAACSSTYCSKTTSSGA